MQSFIIICFSYTDNFLLFLNLNIIKTKNGQKRLTWLSRSCNDHNLFTLAMRLPFSMRTYPLIYKMMRWVTSLICLHFVDFLLRSLDIALHIYLSFSHSLLSHSTILLTFPYNASFYHFSSLAIFLAKCLLRKVI